MKNYISATFFLTLLTVGALLGLYFLPSMKLDGEQLRKVDLLADIRPDVEEVADSDTIVPVSYTHLTLPTNREV